MSEQGGGRYNRSFEGLIGAMIVIVLAIVAFVVFRGAFSRDIDETERDPVDYLESVLPLQQSGLSVVYPATLPEGWIATGVDVDPVERPGDQPGLGLDLQTGDGEYVGIDIVDDDPDDALREIYDDEDVVEDDPLSGAEGVVADWDGWAIGDGDRAYTTAYGDQTLVVYGSAGTDALALLIDRLTDEPLEGVTPAPTPTATG